MAKRARTAAPSSQRPVVSPPKQRSTAPVTTRTTRAQSRELSEPLPTPRKRRTRADSIDDAVVTPIGRRNKRRDRSAKELDAVEEESAGEEITLQPRSSILPVVQPSAGSLASSSSVAESEEEVDDIDASAIPRVLELLDGAASRLLALLLPRNKFIRQQNWKALSDVTSPLHRQFQREIKLLDLQSQELSSHHYIRPTLVRKAVLGVHETWTPEDVEHASRVTPILVKANLVRLMYDLFILSRDLAHDQQRLDCLEEAEKGFSELIAGNSDLEGAVSMNFKLTVQAIIAALHSPSASSSTDVLERYIGSDTERPYSHTYALRFSDDSNPETDAEVTTGCEAWLSQPFAELLEPFQEVNDYTYEETVAALERSHPWSRFESEFLSYAQVRLAEVDSSLASFGGSSSVIQLVEGMLARAGESNRLEELYTKLAQGSEWANQPPAKSAAAVLRRHGKALAQRQGQAKQQQAPVASMLPRSSQVVVSGHIVSPQRNAVVHPSLPSASKSPGHGGGVIDPALSSGNAAGSPYARQHSSQTPDHTPMYDQDNDSDFADIQPTQDGGFEADMRTSTLPSQRRQALRDLQQANASRTVRAPEQNPVPHVTQPQGAPQSTLPRSTLPLNSPESIERRLAELNPSPTRRQTPSSIVQRIEAASIHSNRTRSLLRVQKERNQWTEAEVDRLDFLIRSDLDIPLSYSKLKKKDAALQGDSLFARRKPEDLRFKARNVKTKILRGGGTLPARWDQVVLAKAQIIELEAHGITYIQPKRGEQAEDQLGDQEGDPGEVEEDRE